MKTTSIRHQLVRGALTGVVGTVAMTIPILVCQRLHLFHTPPPVEISANIARRTWLLPEQKGWLPSARAGGARGLSPHVSRLNLDIPVRSFHGG